MFTCKTEDSIQFYNVNRCRVKTWLFVPWRLRLLKCCSFLQVSEQDTPSVLQFLEDYFRILFQSSLNRILYFFLNTARRRRARRSTKKKLSTNRTTSTPGTTPRSTTWTAASTRKSTSRRSTNSTQLSDQSPTPKNVPTWSSPW